MRVKFIYSSRHTRTLDTHNAHRKPYPALAKEVISVADIVLEVLDARFINETRNVELENLAKESGKFLIYILNKSDLVDISKLRASGLLKDIHPYVLVSCKDFVGRKRLRDTLKIQAKRIKLEKADVEEEPMPDGGRVTDLLQHKHGVGYRTFLKISKNIHVGVIGYPNTGKSSLLNMLTGRAAAGVSQNAGFTRGIQKVRFSDDILILDTPGVISQEDAAPSQTSALKKHATIGARTYNSAKNPEFIITEIMQQYPKLLEEHYGVEANGDSEILIDEVGKKLQFLKKGGKIDTDRVARIILKEWQEGKIRRDSY